MTRVISIASAKGGVGKTTLVANLSAALAQFRKNIIAVDANLTTPNLGFHLGIPLYPKTLHDVLRGEAKLGDAIYQHESGFSVIPAGIFFDDMRNVDISNLSRVLGDLPGPADMILIDCAAGLGREARTAIGLSDELLIVTNPELPAVADALKAIKLSEQSGVKTLGAVVNRISNEKHEMTTKEIENMLDVPILSSIPEDIWVKKSIAEKMPVIHLKPDSPASIEIKKLAARIAGVEYESGFGFAKKFFTWFFE